MADRPRRDARPATLREEMEVPMAAPSSWRSASAARSGVGIVDDSAVVGGRFEALPARSRSSAAAFSVKVIAARCSRGMASSSTSASTRSTSASCRNRRLPRRTGWCPDLDDAVAVGLIDGETFGTVASAQIDIVSELGMKGEPLPVGVLMAQTESVGSQYGQSTQVGIPGQLGERGSVLRRCHRRFGRPCRGWRPRSRG